MSSTSQEKLYGPPKVGGDLPAWCNRCKIELAHVCVSMVSGKPARVICKTCKSEHNYKRGGSASPVRSGSSKPKESRTTMRAADYWEKRVAEQKNAKIHPYSTQATFKKNDLVQHTLFGVGIVDEIRSQNKILVTFRVGEKVLVHGLVPPT